ncbi:hypothetical protein CMV_026516 [Castanea mollissima]|uniref:Uncharacterized protein n=1 Tax=Castanea mollissima TaxID=60419 RepID=A0A8J4V3R4_9ROSI|nr:hypothetical protein CMV_026516 [Castanea mollissima]
MGLKKVLKITSDGARVYRSENQAMDFLAKTQTIRIFSFFLSLRSNCTSSVNSACSVNYIPCADCTAHVTVAGKYV